MQYNDTEFISCCCKTASGENQLKRFTQSPLGNLTKIYSCLLFLYAQSPVQMFVWKVRFINIIAAIKINKFDTCMS